MRYVSKIHVLDVMDQIVVSGYVHASEGLDGWSPDVWEFSWQCPGVGLCEPEEWLQDALKRAFPVPRPANLGSR